MAGGDEIARALAALVVDPVLGPLLRAGAPALAWDADGRRILWASPTGTALRDRVSDRDGVLASASPVARHLRALAAGLAPRRGVRLERIRLDPRGLGPPMTCACRIVALDKGGDVLLTVAVGPSSRTAGGSDAAFKLALDDFADVDPSSRAAGGDRRQGRAEPDAAPEAPPAALSRPEPALSQASAAPQAPARPRGRKSVRFLWEADAEGRVTKVSAELADVVGPRSAAIVGRRFDDILGSVALDPSGSSGGLPDPRGVWSGRTLIWRIDGTDEAIPADLAGLPVLDRARRIVGYRGFGLLRPQDRTSWPGSEAVEPEDASAVPVATRFRPEPQAPVPAGSDRGPAEAPDIPSVGDPARNATTTDGAGSMPVPDEAGVLDFALADGLSDADKTGPAPLPGTASPPVPSDPPGPAPGADEPGTAPAGTPGAHSDEAGAAHETADDRPPAGSGRDLNPVGTAEERSAPAAPTAAALSPPREVGRLEPTFVPLRAWALAQWTPDRVVPLQPGDRTSSAAGSPGELPSQAPAPASGLSGTERNAFHEIARALGVRFEAGDPSPAPDIEPATITVLRPSSGDDARTLLDRLPIGVLVHRGEAILHANPAFLELSGYDASEALAATGSVGHLLQGQATTLVRWDEGTAPLTLATRAQGAVPVEVRLATLEWDRRPAGLMLVRRLPDDDPTQRVKALELDLRAQEARIRELSAILDTATDGVAVLDESGRILALNQSAEALFGYDEAEVAGDPLTVLLAPDSHAAALGYLDGLREDGVANLLNDGREVRGRVRQGGTIPLFMTLGRVGDGPERKFCAVLRDMTAANKAHAELDAARRAAEEDSARRADFLSRISHELRTPLNAIIGFAEVMLEGRFGPIGNERYGDYLRDIHESGTRMVRLAGDLLDLAKIEAGRMDLVFTSVDLNALVAACVAAAQPQAAKDRIVIRTALAPKLPSLIADERCLRQAVQTVVANALALTSAGGQVIVSTAPTDRGEVAFRVRDTGAGMTDEELAAALTPFRQTQSVRHGGAYGLALPLTKALVEANRGALQITSVRDEGTLVEALFRPARVPAQ